MNVIPFQKPSPPKELKICSFCKHETKPLVVSSNGVAICASCLEHCKERINEESINTPENA